MSKPVCFFIMFIFLFLNSSIFPVSSGIYRYVMGEKEEMIIDYDYVVVEIENEGLTDWSGIYNSENALDISILPNQFYGNNYLLKVNDQNETATLVYDIEKGDIVYRYDYSEYSEIQYGLMRINPKDWSN